MTEEPLNLGRIAKLCNVSRTTVYRWIINGHLKSYALPSGHFRVHPSDLCEFCQAFGIPSPTELEHWTSNRAGGSNRYRVLIADDHPDMILVLRKVVERFLPGVEIHEASNGVETCIAVGTLRPDLLLLDIMMPGMDGFAVVQELLRRPELSDSRVVVVSAYEPFERVAELGRLHPQISHCIQKPINVERFGALLRACVDQQTSRS